MKTDRHLRRELRRLIHNAEKLEKSLFELNPEDTAIYDPVAEAHKLALAAVETLRKALAAAQRQRLTCKLCDQPHHAQGYCMTHYQANRRAGILLDFSRMEKVREREGSAEAAPMKTNLWR